MKTKTNKNQEDKIVGIFILFQRIIGKIANSKKNSFWKRKCRDWIVLTYRNYKSMSNFPIVHFLSFHQNTKNAQGKSIFLREIWRYIESPNYDISLTLLISECEKEDAQIIQAVQKKMFQILEDEYPKKNLLRWMSISNVFKPYLGPIWWDSEYFKYIHSKSIEYPLLIKESVRKISSEIEDYWILYEALISKNLGNQGEKDILIDRMLELNRTQDIGTSELRQRHDLKECPQIIRNQIIGLLAQKVSIKKQTTT